MSHPLHPDGGVTDEVQELRDSGMVSTTELSRIIGLGTPLSATWIINELGISPKLKLRAGLAFYWDRRQANEIRRALISKLARELEIT